jgi:hypothetical protein
MTHGDPDLANGAQVKAVRLSCNSIYFLICCAGETHICVSTRDQDCILWLHHAHTAWSVCSFWLGLSNVAGATKIARSICSSRLSLGSDTRFFYPGNKYRWLSLFVVDKFCQSTVGCDMDMAKNFGILFSK